jgi:hypothetical protein
MKIQNLLILIAVLCCGMITAQSSKPITDVNTDVDVVKVFEQVVKEGYGTPAVYKELATAHYFKNNYADAKKWYELLFKTELPKDETTRYRYKQTLKALKLYKKNNIYLASSDNH